MSQYFHVFQQLNEKVKLNKMTELIRIAVVIRWLYVV